MADGYLKQRVWYGDNSGGLLVTALVNSQTLVPARAKHTIYVQRVRFVVTGILDPGTWELQDSLGNSITGQVQTTTIPNGYEVDFGANGTPIGPNADLLFVASGGGATGSVTWDAYQRMIDGSTS